MSYSRRRVALLRFHPNTVTVCRLTNKNDKLGSYSIVARPDLVTMFQSTEQAQMVERTRTYLRSDRIADGYSYLIDPGVKPEPKVRIHKVLESLSNPGWRERHTTHDIIMSPYAVAEVVSSTKVEMLSPATSSFSSQIFIRADSINSGTLSRISDRLFFDAEHFIWGHSSPFGGYVYEERGEWSTSHEPIDPRKFYEEVLTPRNVVDIELVTQTLAEANKEELDLLTALAEAPKTFNEILNAMETCMSLAKALRTKNITILSKYKEVNAKINSRYAEKRKRILDRIEKIDKRGSSYSNKVVRENWRLRKLEERKLDELNKWSVRSRNKNAAELTTAVTGLYMWWRYSLQPNLYLIEDYVDTIAAKLSIFSTHRGKQNMQIDIPGSAPLRCLHRCVIKRRYKGDVLVGRGTGSTLSANPLTTVYELIPFSWMVDWFLNIGDVITATLGVNYSEMQKASYTFKIDGSTKIGNSDVVVKSYVRYIINPSDYSGFTINRDPINLLRALDSIAVAWTFTRKGLTSLKHI